MTTAYRSAELLDWVADTLGAWVAVAIIDWRKPREPGASDLPAGQ
jgi:VanZ family protein